MISSGLFNNRSSSQPVQKISNDHFKLWIRRHNTQYVPIIQICEYKLFATYHWERMYTRSYINVYTNISRQHFKFWLLKWKYRITSKSICTDDIRPFGSRFLDKQCDNLKVLLFSHLLPANSKREMHIQVIPQSIFSKYPTKTSRKNSHRVTKIKSLNLRILLIYMT